MFCPSKSGSLVNELGQTHTHRPGKPLVLSGSLPQARPEAFIVQTV